MFAFLIIFLNKVIFPVTVVKILHYIQHSYSLASPEKCKLMRAFAQINLSQFAVGSRDEWSRLQQGDDSYISFIFFILIPLIHFVNLTMESSDSVNEGKNGIQVLLEKQDSQFRALTEAMKDSLNN